MINRAAGGWVHSQHIRGLVEIILKQRFVDWVDDRRRAGVQTWDDLAADLSARLADAASEHGLGGVKISRETVRRWYMASAGT